MAIITPKPTDTPFQNALWNGLSQNWLLIFIIICAIIISVLIYYIIKTIHSNMRKENVKAFKDFNVAKFKVIMYRNIANIMHEIERKDVDINNGKFVYRGKDFSLFDRNKILFSDNDNKYYGFDFDSGEQLMFIKPEYSPKINEIKDLIDTWINKNVIQQLTSGLENVQGTKSIIIAVIVSLVIGLIAGTLIGYFSHTETIVVQETPKAIIKAMEKLIC